MAQVTDGLPGNMGHCPEHGATTGEGLRLPLRGYPGTGRPLPPSAASAAATCQLKALAGSSGSALPCGDPSDSSALGCKDCRPCSHARAQGRLEDNCNLPAYRQVVSRSSCADASQPLTGVLSQGSWQRSISSSAGSQNMRAVIRPLTLSGGGWGFSPACFSSSGGS